MRSRSAGESTSGGTSIDGRFAKTYSTVSRAWSRCAMAAAWSSACCEVSEKSTGQRMCVKRGMVESLNCHQAWPVPRLGAPYFARRSRPAVTATELLPTVADFSARPGRGEHGTRGHACDRRWNRACVAMSRQAARMATLSIPEPLHRYPAWTLVTWLRRLSAAQHWVHQALCALTGHDFLIHREPGRICLECTHCGRRTRGWAIAPPIGRPTTRAAARLRRGVERAA